MTDFYPDPSDTERDTDAGTKVPFPDRLTDDLPYDEELRDYED
jgi:hypothetical protein